MNPLQWPLLESGAHSGPGNSPAIDEEKRPDTPDVQQLHPLTSNEANSEEEKQQLFDHHQNKEVKDETTEIVHENCEVKNNATEGRLNL